MDDSDENPDLNRINARMEQDHRAAILVWFNMLQRAPIDDVTWMRLGYSYLRLGDIVRAFAAFIISYLINQDGKGSKYLAAMLKFDHEIPLDNINLYVEEWLDQFNLQAELASKYVDFKMKNKF